MAQQRQQRGFTLVEIMIVVVIIGLLVTMGLPAFQSAREASQNARFYNDCRTFATAAETYAFEMGMIVGDPGTGDVPADFEDYIKIEKWEGKPSIGGDWDFDLDFGYFGVGAVDYTVPDAQIQKLDEKFDDGDLTTGLIRSESGRVYYVIGNDT